MNRIRFGLIGTSEIAEKMAQALTQCPKTLPKAIYSRSKTKGETFAKKHRIPCVCSTLEDLAKEVDAVYIASPNALHCEQTLFFLERKIPVLCEKPLASNLREVEAMVACAKRNGTYLAEAYKSRWMPAYSLMKEHLADLGPIRNVRFDFSKYSSRYDAHKRGEDVNTFKAEFSNGALLDLGVYCLYPALELFGVPESVSGFGIPVDGGVDGVGCTVMTYDGFLVTLNYSKISTASRACEIQGEEGTMVIDAISTPRKIEIFFRSGAYKAYAPYTEKNDMVYECEAFADALARRDETDGTAFFNAFRILDAVRKSVGIVYPADQK
ncbi:MAG: Gfo/Idh/MocA family oxidoreductase [Clostridia bacterium]|nr:Gfo/Idh/MocA family oxidoreductase [Clostridia bacterium]